MKNSFNPQYLKEKYPNHEINFSENKKVGEGYFGKILKVILGIKYKKSNITRVKNYIIKEFTGENFDYKNENCSEHIDNYIKIWEKLKSLKFNTFKSIRKYEDNKIIIEDLSLNNKFCVSTYHTNTNGDNSNYLKENKIETILNFEKFIDNGFLEMYRMWENKIFITKSDLFFFLGYKGKEVDLELFFGDLDIIKLDYKHIGNPKYGLFYFAMKQFLMLYVESESNDDNSHKNDYNEKYSYYHRYLQQTYIKYEKE